MSWKNNLCACHRTIWALVLASKRDSRCKKWNQSVSWRRKNRLQNVIYGKLRLIFRLTGPDFKIDSLPVGWTEFAIEMSQSRIAIKNSSVEKASSERWKFPAFFLQHFDAVNRFQFATDCFVRKVRYDEYELFENIVIELIESRFFFFFLFVDIFFVVFFFPSKLSQFLFSAENRYVAEKKIRFSYVS